MHLQKVKSRKTFLKKLVFRWRLEGQWRKNQDPDPNPDPLVRGMYPRIRIHTKMSLDPQRCSQGIRMRLNMQWGTSCLGVVAPWTAWWRPGRGRGGARWRWTYGRSPPNPVSNLIIYFIFKYKKYINRYDHVSERLQVRNFVYKNQTIRSDKISRTKK